MKEKGKILSETVERDKTLIEVLIDIRDILNDIRFELRGNPGR